MRIALVNDWLVHLRGQERVFEALCKTFPSADIFTFVYDRNRMPPLYRERRVRTSFIQNMPYARRHFRAYLALYPLAAKTMDLSGYDLVVASSSAFIHGVSVGPRTALVCYCHAPFRYIWSHYNSLAAGRAGTLAKGLLPFRSAFRWWDLEAARRVNAFLAPSRAVQHRIGTYYGRDSVVIPPPVDLDVFRPELSNPQDYFLVVSPLMRWKRVDIAVEAFNRLNLPLKIVGEGEESRRLRSMAAKNVEFLGGFSHDRERDLATLYAGCRAVIIPSEEDFGLASLEAMACGRPVIAFGGGGALETVVDGQTGCLYPEQTPAALARTVTLGGYDRLDPADIRMRAMRYSIHRFHSTILAEAANAVKWRSNTAILPTV